MKLPKLALFAALLVPGSLDAADWPQWLGPKRDGVSPEKGLLQTWPKDGPKLLWTFTHAGEGYSCPVIVGDRLYLSGARGDAEFLFALDLKQVQGGAPKELWAVKIGPRFDGPGKSTWNAGPIATPVVDGGMVYAQGGSGELVGVTTDGKEVWRKSMLKDLAGEVNPIGGGIGSAAGEPKLGWGYSSSPLIDGDNLICVPGGKQGLLAALNKKTGAVVWQSKEVPEQAPYSSPILVEVGGIRQVVQLTYPGTVGVAAKDGRLLWYYKRKRPYPDVLIPTPVFHDNCIFTTTGHPPGGLGTGGDLIRLVPGKDGIKAEEVYSNRSVGVQQGGVVRVGEHLYGYAERPTGGWACVEFKTGKVVWAEKGALERGSVTAADGRLYCLGEDQGTVVLIEASPAGWNEKGRFSLPQKSKLRKPRGKVWTPPVIADGKLYLRDQELLFCYDIKER
jgi:outer membrane protein assembly factor BamB